jgi:hypothetical protein
MKIYVNIFVVYLWDHEGMAGVYITTKNSLKNMSPYKFVWKWNSFLYILELYVSNNLTNALYFFIFTMMMAKPNHVSAKRWQ